ncbi:hypothetical protein HPB50_012902 [Hyalomma asiaticum]|uniref:Uncharacterized protein n=1 Tax=Hyalomma asiaticum TaxID=266040 RepID=A0ACB7TFQ0_HYAAI|nr:hypothetical protein HPB50_012902 [Hyalomma asiaticum]
MDKAAERRARRAAAARARRSDPAVQAREAEASHDSARRRREDPAVRALTLLTSFIEVESGRPQCEVAQEFSISKQTVSDYLKNKGKILEAAEKVSAGKQKNCRDGSHPKLEEALNTVAERHCS